MNVAPRPLSVLSVCSGGGGLDLALERALGARAVVYVEREAFAAATLVARMASAQLGDAPVWDDLLTFDGRPWRGLVDIVAGGTPCQDLSVAGKQAGLDGERSRLFFEQVRVADETQAPLFVWENVGGAARALPAVFAELAKHGYVGACVALRASDVGAPHSRRRFFLLAYRRGVRLSAGVGDACGGVGELQRAARDVVGASGREPLASSNSDRGEPRSAGADVADPGGARQQGSEWAGASREGAGTPRPAAECGRPLEWPPRPDDRDGWARVIATHPHLAPAQPRVRRVADGLAGELVDAWWADRLRLLGNGVVPAQAEAALRFLWAHLEAAQK